LGGVFQNKQEPIRDRIVSTAIRLFAERGFYETPTRLLAEQAEISEPTLFNYFPTKAHILQAIFAEGWGFITEIATASAAKTDNFFEKIERIMGDCINALLSEESCDMLKVILDEVRQIDQGLRNMVVPKEFAQFMTLLQEITISAQKAGILSSDFNLDAFLWTVESIAESLLEIIHRPLQPDIDLPMNFEIEDIKEMVLRFIIGCTVSRAVIEQVIRHNRKLEILPATMDDLIYSLPLPSGIPDFELKVGDHVIFLDFSKTNRFHEVLLDLASVGLKNRALKEFIVFCLTDELGEDVTKDTVKAEISKRGIRDFDNQLVIFHWNDFLQYEFEGKRLKQRAHDGAFIDIGQIAFEFANTQTYDVLRVVSGVTSRLLEYADNRHFLFDYEANLKHSFRKHFPQTPLNFDVDLPYLPMAMICTYRIGHLLSEKTKQFSLLSALKKLLAYHDKLLVLTEEDSLLTGTKAIQYIRDYIRQISLAF